MTEWQPLFESSLQGVADFIEERLLKKLDEYDLEVTGTLRKSLTVEPVENSDSEATIEITSADYGVFLNKGISGLQVKRNTPFVFGQKANVPGFIQLDNGNRQLGVSYRDILAWTKNRAIKFANTTQSGTASIITRSIRRDGIVARPWLDDILIDELPEIDRRIEKAIDEAVEVGIDFDISFLFGDGTRRRLTSLSSGLQQTFR